MVKKASVKLVAMYNGNTVKPSGAVDLNLKADYSELAKCIQLLQMLNNDIRVSVKMPDQKPTKLGTFRLKQWSVSSDGESKVSLNSTTDFVEVDKFKMLVTDERFAVRFDAEIELEEEEEGKEE